MTLHGIDKLSPELRETRLRVRIDELAHLLDKRTRENRALRERVERQQLRIAAMSADQRQMTIRTVWLERNLARAQAGRPSQRLETDS